MSQKYFTFLLLFPLAALLCEAGSISGKVDMGEQRAKPRMKKRYGGGVDRLLKEPPPKGAVIYLQGDFTSEQMQLPEGMPEMKQDGLQFVPAVMPVMVGTTVSFPNMDPVYHNVFSYSKNKRFDLGRFQKGEEAPTVKFEQEGEVKVYCEIHSHMRSTILVVESPYFSVSEPDGSFSLKNVPAGQYVAKAWVNSRKQYEKTITVPDTGNVEVNFED